MRTCLRQLGLIGIAGLWLGACEVPTGVETDREVLGSGRVVTQARTVSGFATIKTSGAHSVIVKRSDEDGVEVRTDDNLLEHVLTHVRSDTLFIEVAQGVQVRPSEPMVVSVHAVDVGALLVGGVVSLDADLGWVPSLEVSVSGVSHVRVSGWTDTQSLEISGVSSYNGLEFETLESVVVASGVSVVKLWVRDRLTVFASGASSIRFRGTPDVFTQLSGGATVGPVQ